MRNGFRFALLVGVAAMSASVGWSDTPKEPPPLKDNPKLPTKKELMAAKLKQTQIILEGMTVNDFDKVAAAGEELVRVTRANDFLNYHKGEEYQFQLTTFRRAAEAVIAKAEDKNMDGVMVAYGDLTLSCMKCHQAMRDKKFAARLPLPGSPGGE